jgi:serine/threonine-protein kinase
MGVVYRAVDSRPEQRALQGGDVAIKLLLPEHAARPDLVERFKGEASTLMALAPHPGIPLCFDCFQDAGTWALVMQWAPGRELKSMIGRETGPIPWERATPLIRQLLDALEHAHQRGVIHRDLKPDNIRVSEDGHLWLIDFGIAKASQAGRGQTQVGSAMGTVDYMAPEQFSGAGEVDARADIYAAAMTVYEMLAGRLPWSDDMGEYQVMNAKAEGNIPPPTDFYPAIPPWVVSALSTALFKDPTRRFASVAAFRRALLSPPSQALPVYGSAAPTASSSPPPPSPMPPPPVVAPPRTVLPSSSTPPGRVSPRTPSPTPAPTSPKPEAKRELRTLIPGPPAARTQSVTPTPPRAVPAAPPASTPWPGVILVVLLVVVGLWTLTRQGQDPQSPLARWVAAIVDGGANALR